MADLDLLGSADSNPVDISSLLNKIDSLVSLSGAVLKSEDEESADYPGPVSDDAQDTSDEGSFTDAQLEEISKGVRAGLPVETYSKKCYNWMQMYEIRLGLMEHLNTDLYASPLFTDKQMHEIRLGLQDRLDVSSYATLVQSYSDMRRIRKTLFSNAYKKNPHQFERTITDEETGIVIHISSDCMKAFVKFPAGLPEDYSASELKDMLESHEILYGVQDDKIKKALKEHPASHEICIAQGKSPTVGKDGWYELFFENCIEKGHTVPPDGEVDYTDINTVDAIKPGDRLIKYHPAEKDTGGITVTGMPVLGVNGEELPVLTGEGIKFDPDTGVYTATASGCASYDDTTSSLNVWRVYHVKGDVHYYQSIEYDGTIHVSGSVRSMSQVRARGDVIIDGFVESANIFSEHNIVIKGGCNGGGQGKIMAGGSVRCNFFENVDVVAKGMVESNYYFNANIDTEDRLVARGKKARIIGGRISAALSVDAVIVGNYLSSKTLFNIGDIYGLEKKISALAMPRKTAIEELQMLNTGKQKLLEMFGEEQAAKNALYIKTSNAVHTKEAQIEELDREISRLRAVSRRAEKAYIKIHGQLQSDVIFIINNVRKETPTTINRSVFLTKKDCLPPQKKKR